MRSDMLSKRLRTVAHMVTRGNRVCDVGCDHGYVSVYLVKQGISPGVLAMDVRKGPLGAAREHVSEYNLEDRIETRLSDGLHNYTAGEAQSLICAGMGGKLMRRILEEDADKTASFQELILQPQSEIEQFRRFLRENGYLVQEEEILEEDGKFYQVIRAVPTGNQTVRAAYGQPVRIRWEAGERKLSEDELCKLEDRYGAINLNKKTTVLLSFLSREERIYGEILESLRDNGLTDERRQDRYEQISTCLLDCRRVQAVLTESVETF